jgi:hypothetical protein
LVASLFTRQGIFWDEVADLRARRGITATVGVPPPADDCVLLPADAPKQQEWERGAQAQEESQEEWFARLHKDYAAFEYKWAWLEDLESILRKTVPVRYRGYRNSTMVECPEWESWQRFIAACVLYDPLETSLSVFARYSEPPYYYVGLPDQTTPDQDKSDFVYMRMPPIRLLKDPDEERRIEAWWFERLLDEVNKRHLKPRGLDLREMLLEVRANSPEIEDELEKKNESNKPSYYIFIDEETRELDVRKAFRTIAAAQSNRKVPLKAPRDRLKALQAAILYDRHNPRDPTDKRRWTWTLERLAAELELGTARTAKDYIELGRDLLDKRIRVQ